MRVSEVAPCDGYPRVQQFIEQVLDMQFADVRAMLQLPRPDIGITAACNFAIVSSLCNLISGISCTIYKPTKLLHELRSKCGSRKCFENLVHEHFPYTPSGVSDFPKQLYKLCRNPMAHSAGLMGAPAPVVAFTRVFHAAHDGTGWTDAELEDLERPDSPFSFQCPSVVIDPQHWTLNLDPFYLDVIKMLHHPCADVDQLQAAELRFSQGIYNWQIVD